MITVRAQAKGLRFDLELDATRGLWSLDYLIKSRNEVIVDKKLFLPMMITRSIFIPWPSGVFDAK
jgi:hypothetical protein